jgi:uncharacterized membrane protein
MIAELLVLRLVHIVGGIFWVGTTLFASFFLLPALAQSGAAAGQVMVGLQQRRLYTVLPTAAILTIVSGLRLMWIASGGFSRAYFSSPVGHTFALSGMAAIIAFFIGMLVARPAAVRVAALGRTVASSADTTARNALSAELERMRRRSAVANTIAAALLLFAAGGMAIARYLG